MALRTVGSGKDYSTIAAAVSAADADDVIQIYAGTYTEDNIGLYDDRITFECGTGSDGSYENVLLSGSDPASAYLLYSYANNITYNNLTFTGYRYVPSRRGSMDAARFRMSGCLVYDVGNVNNDATISIGGSLNNWTGSLESCKIFNMQGDAINAYADYVEINNCLVVSNDTDDHLFQSSGYSNTTASFCTFIGQIDDDALVRAGKVINCIISGSSTDIEGDPSWKGAKGIYSDDSDYNIVTVNNTPFSEADGTSRGTGSANEHTLVTPYFTNAGTIGAYNHSTDDYTLVETKTVAAAVPTSYYTMEAGTGTTLLDRSSAGNSRNGTLVNSPTWDGTHKKVGSYSLFFQDDGNRHVTLHSVPQDIANSDMSMFFWIKTAWADRSSTAVALSINQADNSNRLGFVMHTDGKWNVNATGSNYYAAANHTVIADDEWHHVGWTFNNTTKLLRLYTDGVYDSAVFLRVGQEDDGAAACTIAADDQMFIGSGYRDGTFHDDFEGNIDELSIWNKILEPEHIKDLYAAGIDNESKVSGFSSAEYTNPAISAGVAFTGSFGAVTYDLTGTARTVPDIGAYEYVPIVISSWGTFTQSAELYSRYSGELVINRNKNLSVNYDRNSEQVPYALTLRGPAMLRNRKVPYVTTRSNPSQVVSGATD